MGGLAKFLFCCPCPPGTLVELSFEDCEVCELCRLTTTGLFFLEANEATNFLLATAGVNFPSIFSIFSSMVLVCSRGGEGDCTTTYSFVVPEFDSSSDTAGDMKRAVGRGPFPEGPLVFFSIGGGMGAGVRETDVDVVLGRL